MGKIAAMPEADRGWMIDTLLALLQTPSPSGRTDAVMQLIGDIFNDFGVPFSLTRRGALTAELPGESKHTDRALVVHADTIGCMVRRLKDNGRLELIPVGTFSARFATGARVRIFSDDPDEFITGTVMPLKASGHAFGDEIDTQPTDWEHVEVRIDRKVSSRDDLVAARLEDRGLCRICHQPRTGRRRLHRVPSPRRQGRRGRRTGTGQELQPKTRSCCRTAPRSW